MPNPSAPAEILSALLMPSVLTADDLATMVAQEDWASVKRFIDLRLRRLEDTRQRIEALRSE